MDQRSVTTELESMNDHGSAEESGSGKESVKHSNVAARVRTYQYGFVS